MAITDCDEAVIPLLQEVVRLEKRAVETARVAVCVRTEIDHYEIDQLLVSNKVQVEHIPIGAFIDSVPDIRVEGNVTIYPVVEEAPIGICST